MTFKQDVVMLLLKHGTENVLKYISYRDMDKEVIRINSARFPDCEFVLVPAKHKKLKQLIKQGWRDALVNVQLGPAIHFPQEYLGKKLLLFKSKSNKRIGFV